MKPATKKPIPAKDIEIKNDTARAEKILPRAYGFRPMASNPLAAAMPKLIAAPSNPTAATPAEAMFLVVSGNFVETLKNEWTKFANFSPVEAMKL
jgi:hypothetical protein